MDPDKTPDESLRPRQRIGRLRAALLALRGEPIVAGAIRAEWTAWQWELEALCDKLGAAANRLHSRDKRQLQLAVKKIAELEAERAEPAAPDQLGPPASTYSPEKRRLNRERLASKLQRIGYPIMGNGGTDEPSTQAE